MGIGSRRHEGGALTRDASSVGWRQRSRGQIPSAFRSPVGTGTVWSLLLLASVSQPQPPLQDLRKLISQCWHADVDRRPNFRTIAERLRTLYNVEKHSSKLCMSALNLNEDPYPKRGGAWRRELLQGRLFSSPGIDRTCRGCQTIDVAPRILFVALIPFEAGRGHASRSEDQTMP